MNKDNLKISEIAEMAGISEDKAREIAKKHGNKIPSRNLGRIKIYQETAVDRFREFAETERTEPEPEETPVPRRDRLLQPREPGRAPERRVPGMQDSVALQEQQIKRLIGRIETLQRETAEEREKHEMRISLLERQIAAQQEQMEIMDSWVSFFEKATDEAEARSASQQRALQSWQRETSEQIRWLKLPWWKRLREGQE